MGKLHLGPPHALVKAARRCECRLFTGPPRVRRPDGELEMMNESVEPSWPSEADVSATGKSGERLLKSLHKRQRQDKRRSTVTGESAVPHAPKLPNLPRKQHFSRSAAYGAEHTLPRRPPSGPPRQAVKATRPRAASHGPDRNVVGANVCGFLEGLLGSKLCLGGVLATSAVPSFT
jgi:hypothetical protein